MDDLARKPYDDLDLIVGGRYGPRPLTPTSPIPPANWGLDSFGFMDGVNPAFTHHQRSLSRLGPLDLEGLYKKKTISRSSIRRLFFSPFDFRWTKSIAFCLKLKFWSIFLYFFQSEFVRLLVTP